MKIHKKLKILYTILIFAGIVLAISGKYTYISASEQLQAPGNLTLYNPQVDTILLKWNPVIGAKHYYVYISKDNGSTYELMKSTTNNMLLLNGMEEYHTYYFKVYAAFNGTISKASNIASGKSNVKGIDVSKHQDIIDWAQVKQSGKVDFTIIRCGYGDNMYNQDDEKYVYNFQQCEKYGIPVGTYIYSYAENTAQAQSEADHVRRLIGDLRFDYGIWYDLEDEDTTGRLSASQIGDIAETFCNSIASLGRKVGIYANKYWFTSKLTDERFNRWPKWVAQYNDVCNYNGLYIMWQYTSEGSIPGVNGPVDVNYAFTGKDINTSGVESFNIMDEYDAIIPAPTGLTATMKSANKTDLSWNRVEGSKYYRIYKCGTESGTYTLIGETTDTTFTDEKLAMKKTYYYKVKAFSDRTMSIYSNSSYVKNYLDKAVSLTSEIKSYNRIKISWNKVENATRYYIYKSKSETGEYTKIATTSSPYYIDYGVETGKRMYYKVQSVRTFSDGTIMNGEISDVKSEKAVLGVAGEVIGQSASYSSTKVTFNYVEGATAYEIHRSVSKYGTYRKIAVITNNVYYDRELTTNFVYYYKVKAVRTMGNNITKGASSERVPAKPRLSTPSISRLSTSNKSITLSWNKIYGATGYVIYRCSKIDGSYSLAGKVKDTTNFIDTKRMSGKEYYYKVKAYRYINGKYKYGSWSNIKSIIAK